jgi:hypothetical protein
MLREAAAWDGPGADKMVDCALLPMRDEPHPGLARPQQEQRGPHVAQVEMSSLRDVASLVDEWNGVSFVASADDLDWQK